MKKLFFKTLFSFASVALMIFTSGCASKQAPLPMADDVDLERFMGRWYVHGYTPILVDKQAHNAVEHYRLDENQKIQTTYQFRDGSFDGELKTYTPVGWVHDEATNAEWRMQFLWPFRSAYIIVHVDADYTETIIGHPGRNFAWVMLRDFEISDATYQRLVNKLLAAGYDPGVIQKLPQDWSDEGQRLESMRAEGL